MVSNLYKVLSCVTLILVASFVVCAQEVDSVASLRKAIVEKDSILRTENISKNERIEILTQQAANYQLLVDTLDAKIKNLQADKESKRQHYQMLEILLADDCRIFDTPVPANDVPLPLKSLNNNILQIVNIKQHLDVIDNKINEAGEDAIKYGENPKTFIAKHIRDDMKKVQPIIIELRDSDRSTLSAEREAFFQTQRNRYNKILELYFHE